MIITMNDGFKFQAILPDDAYKYVFEDNREVFIVNTEEQSERLIESIQDFKNKQDDEFYCLEYLNI